MELESRSRKIRAVLWQVLAWNLLLSVLKVALGLGFGLLNLVADGIHSVADSLSNVVGLIATKFTAKKEDEDFPFGYEKFETVGAFIIVGVMSFGVLQIFLEAVKKLFTNEPVAVQPVILWVLAVTIVCNYLISFWENKKGVGLKSEVLVADAAETKSDAWVSLAVLAGLTLMKLGWIPSTSRGDALVTLAVVYFLVRLILKVAKEPVRVLCDAQVIDPEEIKDIVMSVPDVKFCHGVRSHGRKASYFLNLDIGVSAETTIKDAHDIICHAVKAKLRYALPGLKYASIHIEPDTDEGRERRRSSFRDRDSYDHSD